MKLLTEREKVRAVAAAWAKQYAKNGPYGNDTEKQEIAKALSALDPETATASDVAAIIGNNSWCGPSMCDECGQESEVAVQLGEEPDYESATAVVCFDCVQKAMTLMMPNGEVTGAARLYRAASGGMMGWATLPSNSQSRASLDAQHHIFQSNVRGHSLFEVV